MKADRLERQAESAVIWRGSKADGVAEDVIDFGVFYGYGFV